MKTKIVEKIVKYSSVVINAVGVYITSALFLMGLLFIVTLQDIRTEGAAFEMYQQELFGNMAWIAVMLCGGISLVRCVFTSELEVIKVRLVQLATHVFCYIVARAYCASTISPFTDINVEAFLYVLVGIIICGEVLSGIDGKLKDKGSRKMILSRE